MSKQKIITLANARTTVGELTPVTFDGDFGYADVYLSGVFGGATVKIQAEPLTYSDNAPTVGFTDISGAEAITAPAVKRLEVSKNTKLRAVVSGATGTTNISIIAKYELDIQG